MKSIYKNASKSQIIDKLLEMEKESYPLHQPILQRDTFWIYCNARRYWGFYKNAIRDIGINLDTDEIKSDYGYRIDWWPFREGWDQREYLAMILRHMYDNCIDISAHGLKTSPYFDLYTDATLLFGRYDTLISYAEISRDRPEHICYPENKELIDSIVRLYLCDNHEQRYKHIQKITGKLENQDISIESVVTRCPVIVDGANVAYIKDRASMENIHLVDKYLQNAGFLKDNIIFIFDAAFRYVDGIDRDRFDKLVKQDMRYSLAPAGEKADSTILTKAWELLRKNPELPPLIISNDQFNDYFVAHPEHISLKRRKKGVTWTFILKKKEPVINLRDIV
jgi:hypothetical protein